MYLPKHFAEGDREALCNLIRAAPLATLVVAGDADLVVNHVPFVLAPGDDEALRLWAHIPRANPLSDMLDSDRDCVAVFLGADGYVSPSWYATKAEHGKVVPTWNYAVVHAHGTLARVDDAAWVRRQVGLLTDQQEQPRSEPWTVSDAPPAFVDDLLKALVGLEITVARIEGKTKASQNQPDTNRRSVLEALTREAPEAALTELMRAVNKGS